MTSHTFTSKPVSQVVSQPVSQWYAAHVRVNREKVVASALAARKLEAYVPVYREKRAWSDRTREVEFPLFPGYVFCRLSPEGRLPVQITPGVVRIVGSGRTPIPIDDLEMETLRILADSDVPRRPYGDPAVGEMVEIRGGPLTGVTGVLESVDAGESEQNRKLVVSISLLQRSVAVEFDDRWVSVKSRKL